MTDFTRWLYANYIKPHIEHQDRTGYEQPLDVLAGVLRRQRLPAGPTHRRGTQHRLSKLTAIHF